jgi:hypothetical protein
MYQIAIPSYKRATICNNYTLKMLHDNGIDKNLINVFVIEEEYELYEQTLNPDWYGNIIIGKKGLVNQREFINSFYENNDWIISIDDDVRTVDLSFSPYVSLNDFFLSAFNNCLKYNSFIWGVYPVFNEYFRKGRDELSSCLNYIIGAFFGYINRKDCTELIILIGDNKEDVERSILYFKKDGIVLRYNRIGFKTKYFGSDGGGLGTLKDRLYAMKINSEIIESMYPEYCRIKVRKNGLYEIVLKKIKSKMMLL